MKSSNYGLQITSNFMNKFFKEFLTYLLIAIIGGFLLTFLMIHLNFEGGISWYLDLVWKKITFYLNSQIDFLNPTIEDKNKYLIISEYWEQNKNKTDLFILNFFIGFTLSLIGAIYITKKIGFEFKQGKTERNDELKYVYPDELKSEIKADVRNKGNDIEFTDHDLKISTSKIQIPDKIASLHFGMCGASATGKTNAMDEQLVQERKFGNKVLIIDPRGEFFAKHGKKGDHIMSLYDKRAEKWSFWCENLPPKFLANALIEIKESSNSNKFFDKTGREVMAAALRIAKTQEELWQIVNYSEEDLYNLLLDNKELSKQYLGKKASGQSAGVIASAFMNVNFIKYLNHHVYEREKEENIKLEEFSLTNWVNNNDDDSWIFIIDDSINLEDAKPLHRLWFDIVTSASFNRDINKENLKRISLYCDEISTVGNLPTLPLVFDKGRRFKTKMVIGFQSYHQLEIIYGREMAQSIFQGLQNIIVFASNSRKEAEIFSERMGRSEIIELDSSTSVGGHAHTNLSQRIRQVDSVTPSQIQALKDNHAFLKLARFNPTKVIFKYASLQKKNEGCISFVTEKTWLDFVDLKPYESKEMIANKEKEAQEKLKNSENDLQNTKINEFNQTLKKLVDNAVNANTKKPVVKEELSKIAVEIMENFGNSKTVKSKINNKIYAIFINEKSKLIHINYDTFEFTLNFPQATYRDNFNDSNKTENNETESESRGGAIAGRAVSISKNESIQPEKKGEQIINKNEIELNNQTFHSTPFIFRSPLRSNKSEKELKIQSEIESIDVTKEIENESLLNCENEILPELNSINPSNSIDQDHSLDMEIMR